VVANTREFRTAPHDAALPVLFIREQTQIGPMKKSDYSLSLF